MVWASTECNRHHDTVDDPLVVNRKGTSSSIVISWNLAPSLQVEHQHLGRLLPRKAKRSSPLTAPPSPSPPRSVVARAPSSFTGRRVARLRVLIAAFDGLQPSQIDPTARRRSTGWRATASPSPAITPCSPP